MRKSRSLFLVLLALSLSAACAVPSTEGQLLRAFFQACRVYDTIQLARLATAPCNPRVDGAVQDFEVIAVHEGVEEGAESRTITLRVRTRTAGGQAATGTATARLARVAGRWMVAGFTPPPALRTLPAASSAPPK